MKAVMYHYVREYDHNFPNFRFLDYSNFKLQLDYFEEKYGFVAREEWDDFISGSENRNLNNKIVLTFDDAMSCHYDYVYPELLKRGLWGIFYVPVLPYINGEILDVHRIHLLCGKYHGEELYKILKNLITDQMIPDKIRGDFNKAYAKQKNYQGIEEFKKILNYFISYEYRKGIIDEIAEILNFKFSNKSFYISEAGLHEMEKNKNIIGSHTCSHPLMSKIPREEQKIEIERSFNFLSKFNSGDHKTYCHPYGGFKSFNDATIDILDENNVQYSFNVESREIVPADLENCRQFLPRYDCNEFKYGKAT